MNEALRKAVECQCCGMPCDPSEYHPYAACLMFKACHNAQAVWSNLQAVQEAALATHRANHDALVIRLGEVTARLEAADGLLRHAGEVANEYEALIRHMNSGGDFFQFHARIAEAADHV